MWDHIIDFSEIKPFNYSLFDRTEISDKIWSIMSCIFSQRWVELLMTLSRKLSWSTEILHYYVSTIWYKDSLFTIIFYLCYKKCFWHLWSTIISGIWSSPSSPGSETSSIFTSSPWSFFCSCNSGGFLRSFLDNRRHQSWPYS